MKLAGREPITGGGQFVLQRATESRPKVLTVVESARRRENGVLSDVVGKDVSRRAALVNTELLQLVHEVSDYDASSASATAALRPTEPRHFNDDLRVFGADTQLPVGQSVCAAARTYRHHDTLKRTNVEVNVDEITAIDAVVLTTLDTTVALADDFVVVTLMEQFDVLSDAATLTSEM